MCMKHVHFLSPLGEQRDGYERRSFQLQEIFTYLLDSKYPSGFCKADNLALRKRAKFFESKGSDLYYIGRGENVYTSKVL